MTKILSIKEGTFKHKNWVYAGFIIDTDNGKISFGIDDGQQCCEYYGYLSSEDDLDDFVGAEIISICQVNGKDYTSKNVLEYIGQANLNDTIFINVETNRGGFQLVVYNSHNGYYSHNVVCISELLNFTEVL